jgi:hypothetical protein
MQVWFYIFYSTHHANSFDSPNNTMLAYLAYGENRLMNVKAIGITPPFDGSLEICKSPFLEGK